MPPEQSTLQYGIQPKPGSVTYRDSPDGSLHIEVLPKSATQLLPLIACGVAFLLLPMAATIWFWLRGRLDGWMVLVCAFVVIHLLIALPTLVYRAGRHRLYLAAGPDRLSIWTTELGDEIRHDWPRDRIKDILLAENPDGPAHALHIHLRDKPTPIVIPIFREDPTLQEIIHRLRTALKLDPPRPAFPQRGPQPP